MHSARFFPPRLHIFLIQNQTSFKNSEFFFLRKIFPAKRLYSWSLLKAQTLPAKRLSLVFDLFLSRFEAKIFPPKDLFFCLRCFSLRADCLKENCSKLDPISVVKLTRALTIQKFYFKISLLCSLRVLLACQRLST